MTSYICLVCGKFATGDENRRLLNLCPQCEQQVAYAFSNEQIQMESVSLSDEP